MSKKEELPLCPFHCIGCERKVESRYFKNAGPLHFYVKAIRSKTAFGTSPFCPCPETLLYETKEKAEREWVRAVTGK